MKSSPKVEIQYGAVTVPRDKTANECSDKIKPLKDNMDYKKELEQMREEEERLLQKIEKRAKLQALIKQQRERLVVLRRLAGEEERETIPTRKEIEEITKKEEKRAEEVSKVLFLTLQARNMERTFYKETVLVDKDDGAEYKISAIVSVKNVKDNTKVSRPININWVIKRNTMEGIVSLGERKEEPIPKTLDKVIQHFKLDPTKKEERVEIQKSTKPKVLSDVRVSLPRLKIEKTLNKSTKQSEKENKDPKKPERRVKQDSQEIARLKELLARAQRKRSSSFRIESSDDETNSDDHHDNGKELPRAQKSRKSSLAGALKPEAQPEPVVTTLKYSLKMGDQPDKPEVSSQSADVEMETDQQPGEQETIQTFDPVMAGKAISMEEVLTWIEPVEEASQRPAEETQTTEEGANKGEN
ncbi:hypothetical protein RF55_8516 [Lasius niger]|uniref:Uncharacterized protein n=1 Tax=Lasius niger TaxID=67767 RepID=A0A0J7KMS5_LASNI|nr:hypothetical protein RF55_8516 [Lasius niger]